MQEPRLPFESTWATIIRLLGANISRAAFWSLGGLLLWAVLPLGLGAHATTVMTGSMEPLIPSGSVVVSVPMPASELLPGRAVLADDPDWPGRLRLHRISSVHDNGDLITRGDANSHDDSSPISPITVHGVAFLLVPWVGIPIKAFHDGDWALLLSLLAVIGVLTAGTQLDQVYLRNRHRFENSGPARVALNTATAHPFWQTPQS